MSMAAAPEQCGRCGAPLAPGALVCAQCQAMVHASRLEELASSAHGHEQRRELDAARSDWQSALELLPADSSQAAWVRAKLDQLPKRDAPAWTRKLGPFA